MRAAGLLLILSLAACSRDKPSIPADAAVSDRAPAALRALWRESVKYRKAHESRARNLTSFLQDRDKLDRMLVAVEAEKHCPVVADPAADRAQVAAGLEELVLGLSPGTTVTVELGPGPASKPPETALTTVGYDYPDDQIAGHHLVRIGLASPAEGQRLARLLEGYPRLVELVRAEGATVHGRAWFFRDLEPVRFLRPRPDVEALLTKATGGATPVGKAAAKATQVRANYAAVDALDAELSKSLAVSGELKVREGRWRFYKALVDRFERTSWEGLKGG